MKMKTGDEDEDVTKTITTGDEDPATKDDDRR